MFDKSGLPIKRIDIRKILESYQIQLHSLSQVKIPMLEWSARVNNNYHHLLQVGIQNGDEFQNDDPEYDETTKKNLDFEVLRKVIVIGECMLQDEKDTGYSLQNR
jgi:hypothetical protein